MTVADALLAITSGDRTSARQLADTAASSGDDPLATALVAYLADGEADVYGRPDAFTAFIENGGNVALYRDAIELIKAIHESVQPLRVLDIGCGDGRVTAAALTPATREIDLVEPSAELLDAAVSSLPSTAASTSAHNMGIIEYLRSFDHDHWDLAQATFAIHNLAPDTRAAVLEDLAFRAQRLLLIEFDVPRFDDGSREHALYAARRYEIGVGEYREHPEVISGFLLPVLIGQFDPDEPRHTYEQPVTAWAAELESAGFSTVTTTFVSDYWWAPAYLIDAQSETGGFVLDRATDGAR